MKFGGDLRWGGVEPSPRLWFNVRSAKDEPLIKPRCLIIDEDIRVSAAEISVDESTTVLARVRNNTRKEYHIDRLAIAARTQRETQGHWDHPEILATIADDLLLGSGDTYLVEHAVPLTLPGEHDLELLAGERIGNEESAFDWVGLWPYARVGVQVGSQ